MTCDIAIPAVLEGTMNADDAARLQVKLVVRGATGM
jgi:glutamate dehydrogenase/leucine dehydrogenase